MKNMTNRMIKDMTEKEYMQQWNVNNREKRRAYQKKYYRNNKEKILKKGSEWREEHPNYMKERSKAWVKKLRLEVLTHYGGNPPKCACCCENHIIFLTIDHIDNRGAEWRRKNKMKSGCNFYRWLIKNNFPKRFQVLCFNCNYAKSHGGCPHNK